ncbi:NACHT domain-containing protein [Longispora urticae]
MASLKSLPSWVVALGAGAASVPVVGPWISGAVTHRYLGPTVVAVVALVIGGLGKLATDLLGHVRPRLVAWLELLLVRWFSRFGPWYRRVVLTDSRTMGREGFGGLVARGLDLDAVYVDVSLVSRAPRSASPHLVRDGRNESDRRQDLTSYLGDADQAVLVVLGGPGSGKSTLLRRIARQTYRNPKPHGHRIPIFLALREHVAAIVADPAIRLSTLVGRAKAPLLTGGTVPGLLAPEPRRTDALVAWFENLLVAGRCVVLLDGLDEVATEGERSAIVAWANTQILRYAQHGNHYVLSSRPDGYRAGGLDDAAVLEVEPFTAAQVDAFVVDAYDAVGSRESARRAADLSRQLGEASRLRPLTRNPLLLTMLYFVHRDRGSLPSSRLELYRQICRTVLEDRQKDKRIAVPLPVEQAELLLSGLALAMTREGRATTWTRAQVLDALGPHMRALPVTAEAFLDLAGLHGLFVETSLGRYAFTHRTFQEYLAAVALAASPPDTLPVEDPWWHETLLFYAMLTGPDAVVRECLGSDTVTAWALAFDCAEHATDAQPLDPGLAQRLERLLVTSTGSGTSAEQRRLFAGVLATRHLRDVVHTAWDQAICARVVPAKLYLLFQHDNSENLPLDPALAPGGPDATDTAVLGVLGGNAAGFVDWINEASGGPQCRLPTTAEAAASEVSEPATRYGLSLWTVDPPAAAPRLWTRPRRPHPWTVPFEEFQRVCDADLGDLAATVAQLLLARTLSDWRVLSSVRGDPSHHEDPAMDPPFVQARLIDSALDLDMVVRVVRAIDGGLIPPELSPDLRDAGQTWLELAYPGHQNSGTGTRLLLTVYENLAARNHSDAEVLAPALAALTGFLDQGTTEGELAAIRAGEIDAVLDQSRVALLGHRTAAALESAVRQANVTRFAEEQRLEVVTPAFTRAMCQLGRPQNWARAVSPDNLAEITRQACAEFPVLVPSGHLRSWADAACQRLRASALPVFTWRQAASGTLGTRIRVTALCLVEEAENAIPDVRHEARAALVGRFRDIAVGATLLELRERGTLHPTEAILLAVD